MLSILNKQKKLLLVVHEVWELMLLIESIGAMYMAKHGKKYIEATEKVKPRQVACQLTDALDKS